MLNTSGQYYSKAVVDDFMARTAHSGEIVFETNDVPARILEAVDVTKDLLRIVELEAYDQIPLQQKHVHSIQAALDDLKVSYPPAYVNILKHTKAICMINTDPPRLTMCTGTYGEILGLTFMSRWAFSFLPPATLFRESTLYPIQENLYHESLHQVMLGFINEHQTYDRTKRYPTIFIPWHDTQWVVEQGIHALYYYMHILPMRRARLQAVSADSADAQKMQKAIAEAERAISSLNESIADIYDALDDKVQTLIDEFIFVDSKTSVAQ